MGIRWGMSSQCIGAMRGKEARAVREGSTEQMRPSSPDERYRLYIDESGDHVFKKLDSTNHRYLCLLGCWFRALEYRAFHAALEVMKQEHLPHNPDEPIVLHREDLINRRGPFGVFREPGRREAFDNALLDVIAQAEFKFVAIVIDKKAVIDSYGATAAHPYHLAMGFMLQRYCGLLNHISRCGDVMAESRGGREDRLLKDSYERSYQRGAWQQPSRFFQEALTTRQLKLKAKKTNIAGLQLADILGHPVKQEVLRKYGRLNSPAAPFAIRLLEVVRGKFNRHLYDGHEEGYGYVLYPK